MRKNNLQTYFFFNRLSFSAWVPSLPKPRDSCAAASVSMKPPVKKWLEIKAQVFVCPEVKVSKASWSNYSETRFLLGLSLDHCLNRHQRTSYTYNISEIKNQYKKKYLLLSLHFPKHPCERQYIYMYVCIPTDSSTVLNVPVESKSEYLMSMLVMSHLLSEKFC